MQVETGTGVRRKASTVSPKAGHTLAGAGAQYSTETRINLTKVNMDETSLSSSKHRTHVEADCRYACLYSKMLPIAFRWILLFAVGPLRHSFSFAADRTTSTSVVIPVYYAR